MAFKLESSAFADGQPIPERYTCDGEDVSPPLAWTDVPDDTSSLALVCDDPDAPIGTWVHWVLYNIPPGEPGLPAAVPAVEAMENSARHGWNSWRRHGYGGPCPPGKKPHRYVFKLYALDTMLDFKSGGKKKHLLKAMKGHILAEAQLMGTYTRKR